MKPIELGSKKIFLDGGNPKETREIKKLLGFLDGQTTNPSLVARNPEVQRRIENGVKFKRRELLERYREIVEEISREIPQGSVSIEVYADRHTKVSDMIGQAEEMYEWIDNAHIKLPTTAAGLQAAETLSLAGMRLNMTLCFTQEQAAAVYAATQFLNGINGNEPNEKGNVYVSPFIGRLDDRGERGGDLVRNIRRMYRQGDGHVDILAASIRTVEDLMEMICVADIITVPYNTLREWAKEGMQFKAERTSDLKPIEYKDLNLDRKWQDYNFFDVLIGRGLQRFADDWNGLLIKEERYDFRKAT